ncbi:putative GUP1-Multimembrane-spanning protein essential for proton symport of glycerol [Ceraceosorus guamensis]|uniref:Putative GUP1-Multimembrane-spanning protein essential for proton symport of glycerol n=1 Tax=Ceraceosorus guamensis TaxID=1522189 RepID=A0A316VP88_9BASI|nr:putative GUP1-Multimembrane-spanning protein essential for proton symport of glycerol [Ceraceosorus guamensis]PWN39449.1 putative GUP1-Multimembrane-spanning protein essential for proton symport of glycerol [Ceraceosorus guamensis]
MLSGSRGIASFTIDTSLAPSDVDPHTSLASTQRVARNTRETRNPAKSRWKSWEFRAYLLVFLIVVPYMVWVPVQLSQETNPNYPRFSSHLKRGWIAGRMRDDSDFQYRSFRDYFPLLLGLALGHTGLSKSVAMLFDRPTELTRSASPNTHPSRRIFLGLFTGLFILALHGSNAVKLLLLLAFNFVLARTCAGKVYAPILIWTINIGALFLVHWNEGFAWSVWTPALGFLDNYTGLLPRWQINFNISMLRLVSFAMDLHWARLRPVRLYEPSPPASKRSSTPLKRDQYSWSAYLLYILYPPLFVAGPIMTFNDFTRQVAQRDCQPHLTLRDRAAYAVRFVACLFTMELILHFVYVNAIKDSKAWNGATPMQLSMIGFWNLIIVWLKLLIPWRFFRMWALLDGVEAPENMVRCMANNYSTLGFWRSWHRSYNLWIVRYIYVPLGGSSNVVLATLLVFTFVALWHDLSLKLLTWGWLVTLFIIPELAASKVLPAKKFGERSWYRHVCAVGGVLNILLMMSANLVGFAIGLDGVQYLLNQLVGSWNGLKFMLGACTALFCAVHVMFEYREEELRHGISRKC